MKTAVAPPAQAAPAPVEGGKLRITSDGTSIGTHVYAPDGTEIGGIQRVEFIGDSRLPYAAVQMVVTGIDVEVESKLQGVVIIKPKACGCHKKAKKKK